MKKKLSAFILSLTALVLALVMTSGCSFIKTIQQTDDSALVNSTSAAQTVNFNTTPKTRDVNDALVNAVETVKRSAVQITGSGAGSGVIVDISFDDTNETAASWKNDGNMIYIITCHHMISKSGTYGSEGVGEIEIRIPDATYSYYNTDYIFAGYIGNGQPSAYNTQGYAVTLVGGDFESDIAILRLDLDVAAKSGNKLSADKIVKAQIPDNAYSTSLGETVFSIGNPTGALPGSVSRGIVSYLERGILVEEVGKMILMQIDVATNSGNSGGGLYNLYGELVGITNAGASKDLYEGLNFAIPCYLSNHNGFVEIVKNLAGTAGDTNYGYVSGRIAKGFSVTESSGAVYISDVYSQSLIYSELQVNDRIVSIKVAGGEETSVTDATTFESIMDTAQAGNEVVIKVARQTAVGRIGPSIIYETQNKTITMTMEYFRFCNTGV